VRGEVIFSDTFSYADGPLVTVSDGQWQTHSGTPAQVQVSSGRICLTQRKSEDVSVAFQGGAIGPIQALSLYARFNFTFTALPTGTHGAYFAHFKDASPTTGLRCRIFATTNGAASGAFRLGIAAGTNTASAVLEKDLALNKGYELVCRLSLANNISTLWLNPAHESDPGVTSTDDTPAKSATAFAFRQSLASGAGMGELTVDDLIIATSFDEVRAVAAPVILRQPADQLAALGADVSFVVEAAGAAPLFYQWLLNGAELPNGTSPTLLLTGISEADAGSYRVVVRNSVGSITSAPAILTLRPAGLALSVAGVPGGVQLRWVAEPDQPYSVWATGCLGSEYFLLCDGLVFGDGAALFEDFFGDAPQRFYLLSSP
jgi:hypothetical protein